MFHTHLRSRLLLAVWLVLLGHTGCSCSSSSSVPPQPGQPAGTAAGPEGEPAPRSPAEITAAQRNVRTLYLVPGTLREVFADVNQNVVVDLKTNELAFHAWVCRNPDCPGRKTTGEPVKFVWPDPLYFAKPDGTIGSELVADRVAEIVRRGGTALPQCPECLQQRKLESETPEERQKYVEWCVEYVLPETEQRLKELEAEYVRRIAWEREQRK